MIFTDRFERYWRSIRREFWRKSCQVHWRQNFWRLSRLVVENFTAFWHWAWSKGQPQKEEILFLSFLILFLTSCILYSQFWFEKYMLRTFMAPLLTNFNYVERLREFMKSFASVKVKCFVLIWISRKRIDDERTLKHFRRPKY